MNITELANYRLSDAIKFHDRLNPRLWDSSEHLHPAVKDKLLQIAADFQEFLGVLDLDVKDITVSGSNAAYNYTPTSDIDLHLIVDLPQADRSEVFRELFDAKKYQYNEQHNITIGGYDVELYVQDPRQEHHSQGIYSLLKNNWVSVPKRRKPEIDDVSVRSKAEDIAARIDDAVKSKNYQRIVTLHKKIKALRQSGLEQQGEYGSDNLAFKVLRNQGYIKKLIDARNAAKDAELSLQERKKKKKKIRYGFGGYWAPGFSFGDAGESGGDGGGGESMREDNTGMSQGSAIGDTGAQSTWDGVSPDTQEFLSETDDHENIVQDFIQDTAKKLGIADLPRIEMHRDPKWSQQNKSFGMYKPDLHELHVSLSNRHLLDILRTAAHELAHCAQNQHETLPNDAGDTGSEYENQAHAIAGIVMRDYADNHPELFMRQEIEEGTMSRAGAAAALAAAIAMTPAQAQEYLPPEQQPQVQQQGQLNPVQVLNVARTLYRLKHNVTRAGAEEELNQEFKNYIRAYQGDPGAQNLSRLWQMQQRRQQAQQPQQPWTGNQYQREAVQEASGYIPTAAEQNDPRFAMALSPDVRPGATGKNANRLNLKTDAQGRPGLLMKTVNLREGAARDLNDPPGPETPPTMPAGTVRVDVSDMYDWYKLGQHISNMKGLGRHDFGQGPPSTIFSFGDEETEHKFIQDLEATGLDVTDIDPKDPKQPPGMRRIKTDPTYNVAEAFDQPYKFKWEKGDHGDWDALATLDDGTYLSIMFNNEFKNNWMVEFYRNNSQQVTGEGDAQRIFATVLAAIGQFVQKRKPTSLFFSAVKEDDPKGSRARLYASLVTRYAAKLGYSVTTRNDDRGMSFKLTKVKQGVAEDELVESLRQEFALLESEFIGEIKMSPSNLRSEAARTGALAGMEFEMIVPGVKDEDPEPERDYDYDERCRSIEDAVNFFFDDYANGRRDVERLRDAMANDYQEWLSEKIDEHWNRNAVKYIYEYLVNNVDAATIGEIIGVDLSDADGVTKEQALEAAELVTEKELQPYYDDAWDRHREDYNDAWDESDWLDSQDLDRMSDIENAYTITWPHWNYGSGEAEADIDAVAADFSEAIGMPVNASSQYHGGRREAGHYVVEPDGSLRPDSDSDSGLEFVSPPMPIDQMLDQLKKVKEWAGRNGCYTNDSTGLHINISVPEFNSDRLDYVKLALLLGDEYVLDQFGRSSNTYAKSAMSIVRDRVRQNPSSAQALLDKMRGHMEDLATKAIHTGDTSKYTSINTKTGYIEFRSPGGDWLDANFDKVENTLLRFTVALSAAMNPEAYREEYLKKLYKLLEPTARNKNAGDTVRYFADYVAGKIPTAALRSFVKQAQIQRQVAKQPKSGKKYWWRVYKDGQDARNTAMVEVVASSEQEAIDKGAAEFGVFSSEYKAYMDAVALRPYVETEPEYEIFQVAGGNVVQTFRAADNKAALSYFDRTVSAADRPYYDVRRAGTGQAPAPAAGAAGGEFQFELSQTDIENRLGWPDQTGDANYEVINRNTMQPVFLFIANTDQDAGNRYSQILAAMGMPDDIQDYGWRAIGAAIPGSTLDLQRQRAAAAQSTDAAQGGLIDVPGETPNTAPRTLTTPGQPRLRFTGNWLILDPEGREIHRFGGVGNYQIDANAVAMGWLRRHPQAMQAGVTVVPEMA